MLKEIALLAAWGSGFCAQAQLVGGAPPTAPPGGDHPSNGVVELIVVPAPAHLPPRPLKERLAEQPGAYVPWDGLLNVSVRNISLGPARVDEEDWSFEYTIEVLDSSGKPVPMTEHGTTMANAVVSRARDPRGYWGPATRANLKPGQETFVQMSLKEHYQVVPGKAYTIKIKRSAGLPKVDEYGKPLQQRELSCTVVIDERGVPPLAAGQFR